MSASLAKIESLVIRSNISAVTPGTEIDLQAIVERYGVNMILAGTILSVAKRLRISIQLVEAATGTLVWSHAANVTLNDLFGSDPSFA